VVEADADDRTPLGANDIRRVQPATQTHLDGGQLDPRLGESEERQGGRRLEVGRPLSLGERTHTDRTSFQEVRFRIRPVDADPLRE
jgi:hypothetical protein